MRTCKECHRIYHARIEDEYTVVDGHYGKRLYRLYICPHCGNCEVDVTKIAN